MRLPKEKGSSALEFALIAPVFLLILLFMLDIGRALFVMANLQNAAHQAARSLSIGGSVGDTSTLIDELAQAGLSISMAEQIDVNLLECPSPYVASNLDRASVTVSVDFGYLTPLNLLQFFDESASRPNSVTISQSAAWLCEG